MLAAVFEWIGTTNQWCFEVGAGDGRKWSNTLALRDVGWKAALIERHLTEYAKLLKTYACARIETRCIEVSPDNFEDVLFGCKMPSEPDLGVIDVDGPDYALWQSLQKIRPRVMLIEFGEWNQPNHRTQPSDTGTECSVGRDVMIELGISKGYTPVCISYCNLLFIRSDCLQ